VLDDLQWADHSTLDLLVELAKYAPSAPLLVIGIYRSDAVPRGHPVGAMRDTLRRGGVLTEIALEPLGPADTLLLVTRLLGREPPPAFAAALGERTGGVPFLVEALVTAVRGRDCLDTSGTLPLPTTVRDAMLARVDALPEPARRAVETAAVLGTEFPLELLATLNGSEDGLEPLLESGLIAERDFGTAAFRTPLARDAVYAAIPWTRRRSLHRCLAEVLEVRGENVEQRAAHWLAADEPERARRALLDGAKHARRLHANRDVVQLLRRALDQWPRDAKAEEERQRLETLDQLGDAAQAAGLAPDALRAWREVAESAAGASQPVAARALRKIANLHELNCDWARALDVRMDALSAFAAGGERAEAAVEGITAAIRLRLWGRHAAALEVLARAASDAEASGRPELVIRIAALQGNLDARLGRVSDGICSPRRALDSALTLDRPELVGEIYKYLGDAIERSSDFATGAAAALEGVAFCEKRDAAAGVAGCLGCLICILARCGRWQETDDACKRLLASPACDAKARSQALGYAGLLHVWRGELRKGEALLLEADALSRRLEHALMELVCRWGLALHDAAAGKHASAAERCRGILARWRLTDEYYYGMPILRWGATCLARAGDREALRACADAFNDAAATFSHAELLSGLAHVLGETAWLDGDMQRAAEKFEHAVALLEELQLPRERVESLLRASAACAAAGRRDAAVAHAREAARAAGHLGARPLWEAAVATLRELGEPLAGALGPRGASRAERAGLTARQLQILREISKGLTDKEIGRALSLSPRTVEMHVAHALAALDCRSRAEAVRKAGELGVLSPQAQ
jgi:DNA-binding CsgD family transcriptional regulator